MPKDNEGVPNGTARRRHTHGSRGSPRPSSRSASLWATPNSVSRTPSYMAPCGAWHSLSTKQSPSQTPAKQLYTGSRRTCSGSGTSQRRPSTGGLPRVVTAPRSADVEATARRKRKESLEALAGGVMQSAFEGRRQYIRSNSVSPSRTNQSSSVDSSWYGNRDLSSAPLPIGTPKRGRWSPTRRDEALWVPLRLHDGRLWLLFDASDSRAMKFDDNGDAVTGERALSHGSTQLILEHWASSRWLERPQRLAGRTAGSQSVQQVQRAREVFSEWEKQRPARPKKSEEAGVNVAEQLNSALRFQSDDIDRLSEELRDAREKLMTAQAALKGLQSKRLYMEGAHIRSASAVTDDPIAECNTCELSIGERIVALRDFVANSGDTHIAHGTKGFVQEIDEHGDALINFEGLEKSQWLFKRNFFNVKAPVHLRSPRTLEEVPAAVPQNAMDSSCGDDGLPMHANQSNSPHKVPVPPTDSLRLVKTGSSERSGKAPRGAAMSLALVAAQKNPSGSNRSLRSPKQPKSPGSQSLSSQRSGKSSKSSQKNGAKKGTGTEGVQINNQHDPISSLEFSARDGIQEEGTAVYETLVTAACARSVTHDTVLGEISGTPSSELHLALTQLERDHHGNVTVEEWLTWIQTLDAVGQDAFGILTTLRNRLSEIAEDTTDPTDVEVFETDQLTVTSLQVQRQQTPPESPPYDRGPFAGAGLDRIGTGSSAHDRVGSQTTHDSGVGQTAAWQSSTLTMPMGR